MTNLVQLPVRKPKLPAIAGNFAVRREQADLTEFLPAHLEILETPASAKIVSLVWILCGLMAACLLWSCFASLDIYAEAQGRVQPSGRSKVVQPLDTGIVRAVAVSNGSPVKAGDLLVELDSTVTEADRNAARTQLQSLEAEIARRAAEIRAIETGVDPINVAVAYAEDVPEATRTREDSVLASELASYSAKRDALTSQMEEKAARNERLKSGILHRVQLLSALQERLKMRRTLETAQAGTHAAVLDAVQASETEQRNLADDQGQMLENDAAIVSLKRGLDQAKSDFLASQAQHKSDAEQRRADVEQTLIKASDKLRRTRLTAPIDGIVQQLAVTTIGQVVTVGQPLLVVVPAESALEAVGLLENKDVGFVRTGQEVVIKVDAFPFSRYGTIKGTVSRISLEAVDSQEASASANAQAMARPSNYSALSDTPKVQNLVYPVSIALDQHSLQVDGQTVPLLPGMTITAEVRTGSRRVIQYLLSPLWETSSQAAHER